MNQISLTNGQSLLGSLVKNSSHSRSTSLFTKTLITNNNERVRSFSNYKQEERGVTKIHKFIPLCEAVHMLAIKIKKLNYFLFCRLQSNLKQYKENQKKKFKNSEIGYEQNLVIKREQSNNRQQIRIQAINKLAEFIDVIRIKKLNQIPIIKYFRKIKSYSDKISSTNTILVCLNRRRIKNYQMGFEKIYIIYSLFIKFEIITQEINSIYLNFMRTYFLQILFYLQLKKHQTNEQLSKNSQKQTEQSLIITQETYADEFNCTGNQNIPHNNTYNQQQQQYNIQNKLIEIDLKSLQTFKNHNNHTDEHQVDKKENKLAKAKKYIIKKSEYPKILVRIQQPRKTPIISKIIKCYPKFQNLQIISNIKDHQIQQYSSKLKRLHPEVVVNQLSDLNDNLLFQQKIPDPYFQKSINNSQLSNDLRVKRQINQNNFNEVKSFRCSIQLPQICENRVSNHLSMKQKDDANQQIKTNKNIKSSKYEQIEKIMNQMDLAKQKSLMAQCTEESPRKAEKSKSKNKRIVNLAPKKYVKSGRKNLGGGVNQPKNILNSDNKGYQQKENLQVKLFEGKEKVSLSKQKTQRKYRHQKKNSVHVVSSINQAELGRYAIDNKKYKGQLDTPNSYKNRTSLNNFKLVFDQKI